MKKRRGRIGSNKMNRIPTEEEVLIGSYIMNRTVKEKEEQEVTL